MISSGGFKSYVNDCNTSTEASRFDPVYSSIQTRRRVPDFDVEDRSGCTTSIFGYKRKVKAVHPKPVKELLRKFKESGEPNIMTKVVTADQFERMAK